MSTFLEIATEIGELVEQKNAAYGSSFAKAGAYLRLLYPDGIAPHQYDDALLLVRSFDKHMRIATDRDALGESPYGDLAGYGILGVHLHHQRKEQHAAWPDPANVPDAASSSRNSQPTSAVESASATTTTSERPTSEASPARPSRRPGNFFAGLDLASARSVTEPAAPSEVDLSRVGRANQIPQSFNLWVDRNQRGLCAICATTFPNLPFYLSGESFSLIAVCSRTCVRTFDERPR